MKGEREKQHRWRVYKGKQYEGIVKREKQHG